MTNVRTQLRRRPDPERTPPAEMPVDQKGSVVDYFGLRSNPVEFGRSTSIKTEYKGLGLALMASALLLII